MPLFEYECTGCGNKFELLIRGNDAPRCPACGGERVEKCLSVFAVSVKSASPPPASPGACATCPHASGRSGCGLSH
jgi:putative FmdB family regulatory protein